MPKLEAFQPSASSAMAVSISTPRIPEVKGSVMSNVRAREDDIMWISPSGMSFEDATDDDYPGVSISTGEIRHGTRRPSSEVIMHLAIYRRRPDVPAVIHTHPPMTQALTGAGHTIRPMFADYYTSLSAKPEAVSNFLLRSLSQ